MLKEKDLVVGDIYMAKEVDKFLDYIIDMGDLKYTDKEYGRMLCVLTFCPFELVAMDSDSVRMVPRSEFGFGALVMDKKDMFSFFVKYHRVEYIEDDGIEKFIYSNGTTICILDDGSKGVARLKKNDKYDVNTGETVALLKAKRAQALEEKKEMDGFIKFLTRELGHAMKQKEKAALKVDNLLKQIKRF